MDVVGFAFQLDEALGQAMQLDGIAADVPQQRPLLFSSSVDGGAGESKAALCQPEGT